ncbi:hypothetical protein ACIBO6_24285 [Streptomyces luteogriseus]|uniref:hypothetical protein n=1 Tax=Streptomyces luteogriseus TaxID=68233 RepID=UPI00379AB958
MTAHPPLVFTAAAATAFILLARWWVTPRERCRHRVRTLFLPWHRPARNLSKRAARLDRIPERQPQAPDPSAQWVVHEAEQVLSRQWNRLESLYVHHPDGTEPHSR